MDFDQRFLLEFDYIESVVHRLDEFPIKYSTVRLSIVFSQFENVVLIERTAFLDTQRECTGELSLADHSTSKFVVILEEV